ncbi:hypothetical protein G7Y79_00012g032360 [Physcia stellaris]|nr:hypothetical protein G7Y79_00012g032360 [Physcia stellaris]
MVIAEHPELSSNGGHLFSHLVRDFVYIWSLETNDRIRRSLFWLDPSFPVSTSVSLMPYASPHPAQQLDLRSLGYILETVARLYLQTNKWGCAINVQAHKPHEPSPANGLLDIFVGPQARSPPVSINATLLSDDVKIDMEYTGIGITRRTICALFYGALTAVCRLDYDAVCPRAEEIGIARLVSPDHAVVMQVTVLQRPPPQRPMLMGQLGARCMRC